MKKSIIYLAMAAMALSAGKVSAEEGKVTFGLEVAPAVTWLTMSDHPEIEEDGAKMKFNGGLVVYFNYGDENKYSVFTGLNYNSYGGFLEGNLAAAAAKGNANAAAQLVTGPNKERLKYNFGEFEIPVGVRLRTGSFGNWRFAAHLNLGLAVTVHGNASMKDYNGANDYPLDDYSRKTYSYSPMRLRGTYGLALGAEYDLDAVVLTGKVRYKGSMSNMYFYNDGMFNPSATLNLQDKEDKTYSENVTFLPHILELAIGVLF
ncbi:MAG: outer membrane beta-barrel protein [Paludibacteraceae bacterium]|nr:outer membrane beta-barrel protein [Paludibacteraceae bacterium]